MIRPTGLLWDPSDPIQSKRPISAKYGFKFGGFSDAAMPEELMQSDRDDIRDQGPTQSCTGFALTDAARTSCILRGSDPGPLSALTSYAAARIKGKDAKYLVEGEGYKLWTDEGAYTTPLMLGAESYGFAPETAWPFDAAKVNDVPDFHALVKAHDQRLSLNAWERVVTAQDIRRAMHAKCTIIIALNVTDSFLGSDDGLIDRMTGNILGGHMLALRGYGHETINGAKVRGFDGVNSWGDGWGDDGWFFVTDAVIESKAFLAAVAIKAAPSKVAA